VSEAESRRVSALAEVIVSPVSVHEAGRAGAGRKYAGGLPVPKRTVHANRCGMNALSASEKSYTGTGNAEGIAISRGSGSLSIVH
jgi:hypothetical protein